MKKDTYAIRIKDGEFILYNHCNKCLKLTDKNVNKENLKKTIQEVLQVKIQPMKVRDLIYYSLSLLSGVEVRKACKLVTDQEACDPLYQELFEFVLSLDEYKELIKPTRCLHVTKAEFILLDINGVISSIKNIDIDFLKLQEKFNACDLKLISKTQILKKVLTEYFEVYDCKITYLNPLVHFFTQASTRKKLIFQNGKICIRIDNEVFPYDISIDVLKKAIEEYLEKKPSVNVKNIIFSALELLSGEKVLRYIPTYETTYVGEHKIKKENLIEDPLYIELVHFVESLPSYQENLKKQIEITRLRHDSIRERRNCEKELRFVDNNFAFYGTYIPKHVKHKM